MKDRMKVYHGIPKSVPDNNTIFYASFDGSIKPEIGTINAINPLNFSNTPTGYGGNFTGNRPYIDFNPLDEITVDLWVNLESVQSEESQSPYLFSIGDNTNLLAMYFDLPNNKINVNKQLNNGTVANAIVVGEKVVFKGFAHIRFTLTKEIGRIYLNGKLIGSNNSLTTVGNNVILNKFKVLSRMDATRKTKGLIADLHISNIDRGDYFPNLPQDFIEGKAIVKEKFSQQQIKGDPMCSQVTELKVPCWGNSLGNYANNIVDSDNCYRYTPTPELSVRGSTNWESGTKIKVEGLNGEVISGVIDTDTALCRVEEDGSMSSSMSHIVKVDDTSKIQVNDIIRWCKSDLSQSSARTPKVTAKTSNTITIEYDSNAIADFKKGDYFVETTASSSSPIVKSQDGQTVVGTWSGLGTNSALFTLGTNTPSLEGKDLYVTYSLNMPSNNSHFTDIPYSVDKAYTETGVEMKPVTEIVIEDDFRGKVSGSTKECPHKSSFVHQTTLKLPNESGWTEFGISSALYTSMYYQGDGKIASLSNNSTIPQHLISFNLIDMIERKLGTIPSSNKLQWVKDNIKNIELGINCYGTSNTGSLVNAQAYDKQGNWSTNVRSHTNNTFQTLILGESNSTINQYRLCDDGTVKYLVSSALATGGINSILYIDYIYFRLTLSLPTNFQALFCDNKRAREVPCNPVLVQKETKTVQRLIPSKESFVTESKSGVSKSTNSSSVSHTILHKSDFVYVTTQGTGSYNSVVDDYYRECIAKLTNDPTIKSSEFINEELARTFVDSVKFIKVNSFSYPGNSMGIHPSDLLPNITNKVFIKPYLINANGELKIRLFIRNGKGATIPNNIDRIYNLPNRPLIK